LNQAQEFDSNAFRRFAKRKLYIVFLLTLNSFYSHHLTHLTRNIDSISSESISPGVLRLITGFLNIKIYRIHMEILDGMKKIDPVDSKFCIVV